MSSRAEAFPRGLVAAVLTMTMVVLGLGAAILVIKLKPAELPAAAADRNIEIWKRAVAAAPDDDRTHVGLGLVLLDAGRDDEARTEFETALDLNDQNWVALTQLALLVQHENAERALDLLGRAAKWAPDGSKVVPLVYEGELLLGQGDAKQAKVAFRKALDDDAGTFDAHVGLARALEALGDDDGALAEYEKAAQFDPTNQELAEAIARLSGRS